MAGFVRLGYGWGHRCGSTALARYWALSSELLKLLLDWREASLTEQSDDLIFAAFVRSLTLEQQSALAGVIELVEGDEAFRWFWPSKLTFCALAQSD